MLFTNRLSQVNRDRGWIGLVIFLVGMISVLIAWLTTDASIHNLVQLAIFGALCLPGLFMVYLGFQLVRQDFIHAAVLQEFKVDLLDDWEGGLQKISGSIIQQATFVDNALKEHTSGREKYSTDYKEQLRKFKQLQRVAKPLPVPEVNKEWYQLVSALAATQSGQSAPALISDIRTGTS